MADRKNPHAVALNRDDISDSARSHAAALLGVRGGTVTSEAKADAARANGKKGGRPKKKR